MALDPLEFRSPIAEYTRQDKTVIPLLFTATWQRRLKSLWAFIKKAQVTATLAFPNTPAGQSSPLTVSVPTAALGDFVEVSPVTPGLIIASSFYKAIVSANETVTVLFVNVSAASIAPPSGTFQIRVTPQ